jgi:hypothetical protein
MSAQVRRMAVVLLCNCNAMMFVKSSGEVVSLKLVTKGSNARDQRMLSEMQSSSSARAARLAK